MKRLEVILERNVMGNTGWYTEYQKVFLDLPPEINVETYGGTPWRVVSGSIKDVLLTNTFCNLPAE